MQRSRRPARPITPENLDKAALAYLERYASPAEQLRRVLMRRVERAARDGICERGQGAAMVDAAIGRLRDARLLDDRGFAEARARRLAERGMPRPRIARMLAARGVARDDVADALAGLDEGGAGDELAAALVFARRKRLGPFRPAQARAARRDKDIAALGRAGFSWETARRVVEAASAGDLEAEVAERRAGG